MWTREEGLIPLVVGTREDCAAVEEDLDDLVVVRVRRQDQRRDVRGEGRRVRGDRLPALDCCQFSNSRHFSDISPYPRLALFVDRLLVIKQHLAKGIIFSILNIFS